MAITAQMHQELREKTGAGIMDCKRALTETDGDFEKAIEVLRKRTCCRCAKDPDGQPARGQLPPIFIQVEKLGCWLK